MVFGGDLNARHSAVCVCVRAVCVCGRAGGDLIPLVIHSSATGLLPKHHNIFGEDLVLGILERIQKSCNLISVGVVRGC